MNVINYNFDDAYKYINDRWNEHVNQRVIEED